MANTKSTTKATTKAQTPKTSIKETEVEGIKTVVEEDRVQEEIKSPVVKEVKETAKQPRKIEKEEGICCRSVTPGTLLYNGMKSGVPYSWGGVDDTTFVEYQDLLAGLMSRSDYLFKPSFVIEDEDVLKDPKFVEIEKLYEGMNNIGSVKDILDLPNNKFRVAFEKCPRGLQNAIKVEVATRIANGTWDSLTKIQVIDEICGTDLKLLV